MRLIAFSVEGYRRFVEKTSVKLHGDLVAFVGPNEAGKSSLLRALAHLTDQGEYEPNERPRRTNSEPNLTCCGARSTGFVTSTITNGSTRTSRRWPTLGLPTLPRCPYGHDGCCTCSLRRWPTRQC